MIYNHIMREYINNNQGNIQTKSHAAMAIQNSLRYAHEPYVEKHNLLQNEEATQIINNCKKETEELMDKFPVGCSVNMPYVERVRRDGTIVSYKKGETHSVYTNVSVQWHDDNHVSCPRIGLLKNAILLSDTLEIIPHTIAQIKERAIGIVSEFLLEESQKKVIDIPSAETEIAFQIKNKLMRIKNKKYKKNVLQKLQGISDDDIRSIAQKVLDSEG